VSSWAADTELAAHAARDGSLRRLASGPADGVTRQTSPPFDRREFFAELGGTALLIFVGLMAEAQVQTAPDGSLGSYPTIALAWGGGVMVACYMFGPISGGHINPAVTLALAVIGRFPWRKVPHYVVAQLLGAFIGAALVRLLTLPLIDRFDPGLTMRSQAVFSTLPGNGVPHLWALANEAAGTFVLLVVLLVLLDRAESSSVMADLEPPLIGITVTVIGLSLGSLSGWAINPARDLPPRLLQAWTGYDTAWVDQTGSPYWWVPVIGPILGGALGALAFHLPRSVQFGRRRRSRRADVPLLRVTA
jgi:glycerol uptake facilitator